MLVVTKLDQFEQHSLLLYRKQVSAFCFSDGDYLSSVLVGSCLFPLSVLAGLLLRIFSRNTIQYSICVFSSFLGNSRCRRYRAFTLCVRLGNAVGQGARSPRRARLLPARRVWRTMAVNIQCLLVLSLIPCKRRKIGDLCALVSRENHPRHVHHQGKLPPFSTHHLPVLPAPSILVAGRERAWDSTR